ncbi:hypothetical protein LRS10_12870 [Phenylobacterium sp. J426]|uniref:hypothetical protein n=1 Tax=Phenylobacterium sp. J426 TaxID=2898439 RepID=UPI002150751B|nr:hypothetical protein [Phenylobacterium sp. J426]MCR5874992.1 hypothetical protein [Phenylobacterium sp. J426]
MAYVYIPSARSSVGQVDLSGRGCAQSSTPKSHCAGSSPALVYWRKERQPDLIANTPADLDNLIGLDAERQLDPDRTLALYSDDDLICWADRGDPLAEYLRAARLIGATNTYRMDDPERLPRLVAAQPHLRAAATGRPCIGGLPRAARAFFGCGRGLAEAQFLVGECHLPDVGCPVDMDEAKRWLRRSADQDFTRAKITLNSLEDAKR